MQLLRRTWIRDGALAAVVLLVALLAATGVVLSGGLARASTDGIRAGVAGLRGIDGGFRVTLPLARDADAQDRRVRATASDVATPDGPLAVTVLRDLESADPLGFDATNRVVRVQVASIPHLADTARLVDGRWPRDPAEASLQADAATRLDVKVGDRLRAPDGSPITITATWRVRDPADPRWLGSALPLTGADDTGIGGFLVVDPSRWGDLGARPLARWTVLPRAARLTAAQLPALAAAPDGVGDRLGRAADVDGRLQRALVPLQQRLLAATAVMTAPLLVTALLGIFAVVELIRLRERDRGAGTLLLRARGVSSARLAAADAPAAVAVVVAAAGGAGAALVATPSASVATAGVVAAGSGLVSVALLLAGGALSARDRIRTAVGPRARSVAEPALVVLVALVAIVTTAQLLLYGSPLRSMPDGSPAVDPLADSAPALLLLAVALLAAAAFPLVGRIAERSASATIGPAAFAGRRLARRGRAAVAPVLLLALATATATVAAGYSGTWQGAAEATRTAATGTDVRLLAPTALPTRALADLPGQRAAAAGASSDAQVGDELTTIVELPASAIPRVVVPVAGAVDPAALARAVAASGRRPTLPAGTSAVVLRFASVPAGVMPEAADLVVADATGSVSTLYAPIDGDALRTPAPAGRGPWTVRAIDLALPATSTAVTVRVRELAATVGGVARAVRLDDGWTPVGADHGVGGAGTSGAGVRVATPGPPLRVRLMPQSARDPLPIAVSTALADAAGLRRGARLDLGIVASGGRVPAVVRAVVPVVPGAGTDEGVLADLGSTRDALIAADLHVPDEAEWWIRTSDPVAAAHRAARTLPAEGELRSRAPDGSDAVLETARVESLVAALVGVLLALVAVGAVLVAEEAGRRREIAVLTALGVAPARQARLRTAELAVLSGAGIVGGLLGGAITAALVAPALASSAIPDPLAAIPATLRLDAPVALAGAAVILLGVGLGLAGAAVSTRRTARRSTAAELR